MFESEAIKGFIFRRKRRPPDCMMPQSDIQMRGEEVSKKEKKKFSKIPYLESRMSYSRHLYHRPKKRPFPQAQNKLASSVDALAISQI